eukprot:COSAG01_NODE_14692_length_1421_cov_2.011346_1_plen_133_part_10
MHACQQEGEEAGGAEAEAEAELEEEQARGEQHDVEGTAAEGTGGAVTESSPSTTAAAAAAAAAASSSASSFSAATATMASEPGMGDLRQLLSGLWRWRSDLALAFVRPPRAPPYELAALGPPPAAWRAVRRRR